MKTEVDESADAFAGEIAAFFKCKLAIVLVAGLLSVSTLVIPPSVFSCGLEPMVQGGLGGGYPGALKVAVAVADAREGGLLPSAKLKVPNKIRFQLIMRDVVTLQARLERIQKHSADAGSNDFSLMLAGPSFWAHYHLKPGGVLARYHADGPLENEVVVITHQVVLSALLRGTISISQATDLGLLKFTGANTAPIQEALELSL